MKKHSGVIAVIVTIILAIIGFAVSYGSLSARLISAQDEIENIRVEYCTINEKLDDIRSRLSVVETRLEYIKNGLEAR